MNRHIDQFCENHEVETHRALTTTCGPSGPRSTVKERTVKQDVQLRLDSVKKRIAQDRTKLEAAQADIRKWADERKGATDEKIAEWKAKLEKARLKGRAEAAERYAVGAAVVALAAVDEAEQASLEAWLARKDPTARRARKRPEQCSLAECILILGCAGCARRLVCDIVASS